VFWNRLSRKSFSKTMEPASSASPIAEVFAIGSEMKWYGGREPPIRGSQPKCQLSWSCCSLLNAANKRAGLGRVEMERVG
jgi:hypothetical protein